MCFSILILLYIALIRMRCSDDTRKLRTRCKAKTESVDSHCPTLEHSLPREGTFTEE